MPSTTRDFHHDLYRPAALEETKAAYGELLNVSIEHGEHTTNATFEHEGDDLGFYVDAFSNHALFLTIQKFRDGQTA